MLGGLRNLVPFVLAFCTVCAAQNFPQTTPPPPVTSGEDIALPGRGVPADHSQLSEHNREWVMTQPPQTQMEFLLGAALNHDHGATDMINKVVDDWHGKVHYT